MSPRPLARRWGAWLARLYPAWFREREGQNLDRALTAALDWRLARLGPDAKGSGGLLLVTPILSALVDAFRLRLLPTPLTHCSSRRKPTMSLLGQDLRFVRRSLLQRPAYFLIGALTLALGIGANTLIFSVVESTLLRPLPYQDSEEVVTIWSQWVDNPKTWVSQAEYAAYRDLVKSFEGVALFSQFQLTLEHGEVPERLSAAAVTPGMLDVLGLSPSRGRGFTQEEAQSGASVVMLSHELWQRRFDGDARVLNTTIRLNGNPTQVVGILPEGLVLPQDLAQGRRSEVWAPMPDPETFIAMPPNGGPHGALGVARLSPSANLEQARAEVKMLNEAMTQDGVYTNEWKFRTLLTPVDDEVTGSIRPAVRLLSGAVGLALLIACANLANLCFTQALRRRRELAMRSALGAGSWQLARLLLTEALGIALTGGILGLALAIGGLRLLKGLAAHQIPRLADASLNGRVLFFTAVVTTMAALAFGLLPAIWASRRQRDLRAGASLPKSPEWTRMAAVAVQVALAVMLLTGTGLMLRTVQQLLHLDPGFDRHNVLTFGLYLPDPGYPENTDVTAFFSEAVERISAVPGVSAVGAVRLLPLATTMGDYGVVVEGYEPEPGEQPAAEWQSATPGYFEAMGIPVRQGRSFTAGDDAAGSPVMIVNEAFVQHYLPGRSPLGQRVKIGGATNNERPWTTIVGVVANVAHSELTEEVRSCWYLPQEQFHLSTRFASRSMFFAVRSGGPGGTGATAVLPEVRQVLRDMDPRLPLSDIATLEQVVGASVATSRLATALLLAFSVLALVLAAVGIYGVTAALVTQRRRELGIRLSLGALPRQAMSLIVGHGASAIAIGLAIGFVGAFLGTRFLGSLLYGVGTRDPLTLLGAPLLIAVAGLLACYLPARRAARVDPRTVLRES